MGKFDKYDGLVKFNFNDEDYVIEFKTEDLKDIVKLSSVYKKTGEMDLTMLKTALMTVLSRSYPTEPKDRIEKFLDMHMLEFYSEFCVASGLIDREKLVNIKKKMEEQMEADFLKAAKQQNV